MLEHYRGSFGKDEGLVLEEYWRAGIEIKTDAIDYNSRIHKRIEEKSKQRVEGIVLLKSADTRHFGVLLVDLENNFSRRVDQYPKDMTEAYNFLVKHNPLQIITIKVEEIGEEKGGVRMIKKGKTYFPKTRQSSIMGSRATTVERKDTMLEIVGV